MDVKEFQSSRQKTLDDFRKTYNHLKTSYSQAVLSAIQEKDPEKQNELIQVALLANSTMTEEIRAMITEMSKSQDGFSPKTLDELTNDLVEYQKQYQDIQQNKDRYNTLIYGSNAEKLQSATNMFYVYLGALVLLCIVIVVLIIRTGWIQTLAQTAVQMVTPGQG